MIRLITCYLRTAYIDHRTYTVRPRRLPCGGRRVDVYGGTLRDCAPRRAVSVVNRFKTAGQHSGTPTHISAFNRTAGAAERRATGECCLQTVESSERRLETWSMLFALAASHSPQVVCSGHVVFRV